MKHLITIFFCQLIFGVFGQVVIKGKIINYDGKTKMYYYPTTEGIYSFYWIDIVPSASGSFKIEFENEGFGETTLGLKNGGPTYRFFHDTNSTIYIEFDQGVVSSLQNTDSLDVGNTTRTNFIRNKATKVINGDYQEINKFYNSNIRTTIYSANNLSGTYYSDLIIKEQSPQKAVFILDSLKQLEIEQIGKLSYTLYLEDEQKEKKEKKIKKFLINEVQAFYGSVFMNAMIIKRRQQLSQNSNNSTSKQDIYNKEWEKLVEGFILTAIQNHEPVVNSADYKDFLNLLLVSKNQYKVLPRQQSEIKTNEEYVINRFYNFDTLVIKDQQTKLLYYLDGFQVFLNNQSYYSPALLSAYYDILSLHPKSANLKYFEPQVNKLKSYLKDSNDNFDDGIIINRKHKTLESLLTEFSGKSIFIDIWATWCRPCIEEFKYRQDLQPFVDSLQLEVLYISIDKPEWEDRWKNSIKFNGLQGYHFRANKVFVEDMWLKLGGRQGSIPRYALVDVQGQIFLSSASRPSAGKKLVDEIEQLLNGH